MAHETEAAALLRSGNLFSRRVGLRDAVGGLTFIGVKRGAFAIYLDDEPYDHFDLDGRWQRSFAGGTHFRKALDGSVDAFDRVREGENLVLRRRRLTFAETGTLDATIRQRVLDLDATLEPGALEVVPPPTGTALGRDEVRELLARVARWDAAAWFRQRELHFETYAPIGLLPPDAHNCAVLQATVGDPSGYPFGGGTPTCHDVRDRERFEEHLRVVARMLGRRLAQCRAVFLGGSDALRQPIEQVVGWFEAIQEVWPVSPSSGKIHRPDGAPDEVLLAGIDTFLGDFTPTLPNREAWRSLKEIGLGRVNLGIESGDPSVRSLHGRAWSDDQLRDLVGDLGAEGIPIGLMVLAGAGGVEHESARTAATIQLVDSLPMRRGDLVYLLDANSFGDSSLGGQVHPLSAAAIEAQQVAIKERLSDFRDRTGAKVVVYNPDKQWN